MLGQETDGLTGWFLAGIASVVATLSSAVAVLFRINQKASSDEIAGLTARCDELDKQSRECLEDRAQLRVKVAEIETKLTLYIEAHEKLELKPPKEE